MGNILRILCFLVMGTWPMFLMAEVQVLVSYDLEGVGEAVSEIVPSETGEGLEVSPLTLGPKVLLSTLPGAFAAHSWTTHSEPTDNRYFEFTVTPLGGGAFSFSELVFAEVRGAKGPGFYVIKSSRDQFSAPVGEPVELMRLPGRSDQCIVFDSSFQAITEPVTFRIYAYAAESGAGIWGLGNTSDGQPVRLLGRRENP